MNPTTTNTTPAHALDVAAVRRDFPILRRQVHGKRLVYLDNAATTQRPDSVIDAISDFYRNSNANVHRGVHTLAEEATELFEGARAKVASFLHADSPKSIVFTRNTTESINLVAHAWGRRHLREGDEILLTVAEHHSNLVPWQMLAQEVGCKLRFLDIDDEGQLRVDQLDDLLTDRTRLVALSQVSNVLGTINPVRTIACAARARGARVLVDGAQGVPHGPVDVGLLDADFYAFSPHKACGPFGIGVLWARRDLLEEMDPFLGGGEMIRDVTLERSTYAGPPTRFEAGTPSVADAIGLGASIDYLQALGPENIRHHELELGAYLLERLQELPFLDLYGSMDPHARCSLISFNDRDIHPHDLGTIVDRSGVAIRAGHHCAKPLMRRLGVLASSRASFYIYNDRDDVDALVEALLEARKVFGLSEADMHGLDDLYREVILDHYRSPHGADDIESPSVSAEGFNPLCGDELVLKLEVADGRIRKVHVKPSGCSISVASASMLAQQLQGRELADALQVKEAFKQVMRGGDWPDGFDGGDLEALEGVKNFPVRIKCALLAWMTLEQALSEVAPELTGELELDSDIEVRPHQKV